MTREKVIYSIERCICHVPDACRDCPYDAGHPYNECIEMLLKDAMELLKEQEPKQVVMTTNSYGTKFYHCPRCNHDIYAYPRQMYCSQCGQAVKWDGKAD